MILLVAFLLIGGFTAPAVAETDFHDQVVNQYSLTYSLAGDSAYRHIVFDGSPELDAASHLRFARDLRDENQEGRVGCDPRLAITLAEVQRRTKKHITIHSGYRTAETNKNVNGAKDSYHRNCSAIDFELSNTTAEALAIIVVAVADDLWGDHLGGIGVNATTVHFDTGGRRFWKD